MAVSVIAPYNPLDCPITGISTVASRTADVSINTATAATASTPTDLLGKYSEFSASSLLSQVFLYL